MEKHLKPGQHVLATLRRMIAAGELEDGKRIAEIATAELLGVSRMPVRTALRTLEQEGLVVRLGARGYAARGPSTKQIEDAIEVRGALEGLAARRAAESEDRLTIVASLQECLTKGEAIFASGSLNPSDLDRFYQYNCRLHDIIVQASGNAAIAHALARNNHLPFASAAALMLDSNDLQSEYDHLLAAHKQHKSVVESIARGEPDQAEKAMRCHARAPINDTKIPFRYRHRHAIRL